MRVYAFGVAFLAVMVPASLPAQACLGLPSADGQIGVAGSATFQDGETEIGGAFHVDVTGPASFRVEYGNGHDDGMGRSYAALGSYELFLLEPSICAVGGAVYTVDSAPGIEDRLGLAAGFGIGKTLRADRFTTTVYAIPRYVWLNETRGALGGDETVSSNEFMAEAGVTIGFTSIFVGGDVILSTIGDAEPGIRIRVGLLF